MTGLRPQDPPSLSGSRLLILWRLICSPSHHCTCEGQRREWFHSWIESLRSNSSGFSVITSQRNSNNLIHQVYLSRDTVKLVKSCPSLPRINGFSWCISLFRPFAETDALSLFKMMLIPANAFLGQCVCLFCVTSSELYPYRSWLMNWP